MTIEYRATAWKDFRTFGYVAVRIWAAKTPFGMFQRHEWQRGDGSTWEEPWIPSPFRTWGAHMLPAVRPLSDTQSDLIEALSSILTAHTLTNRQVDAMHTAIALVSKDLEL